MNLNIPVLAMSLIGVLLVVAGLFTQSGNFVLVLFGLLAVVAAWGFQEAGKRRS
jgi:hypothetical protein